MMLYEKFANLNPMDFFMQAKVREKRIESAEAKDIQIDFKTNVKAKLLHPGIQDMVISRIEEHPAADAKTFFLKRADGQPAAWFHAGQYLSIFLKIGDSVLTRPISISSSPALTREGMYSITVKHNPNGFASGWMLENWKVGDEVRVSEPLGEFYYEPLRDAKKVVALAGGSGITPFLAMAEAVRDGIEDMDLTVIFGNRTQDSILFKEDFDKICGETDKVKIVHVLSDEEAEGYEHGFITADLIRKYAGENDSIFVCGPEAMYRFVMDELEKLAVDKKHARLELMGVAKDPAKLDGYPAECAGKTFSLTIEQFDKTYRVPAAAGEPLLAAIERAGIAAPSRCRSGECGWCRSKLLEGEVFIPEETDGRRAADKIHGYIHPCAAFPLSDVVIEVPGSDMV